MSATLGLNREASWFVTSAIKIWFFNVCQGRQQAYRLLEESRNQLYLAGLHNPVNQNEMRKDLVTRIK